MSETYLPDNVGDVIRYYSSEENTYASEVSLPEESPESPNFVHTSDSEEIVSSQNVHDYEQAENDEFFDHGQGRELEAAINAEWETSFHLPGSSLYANDANLLNSNVQTMSRSSSSSTYVHVDSEGDAESVSDSTAYGSPGDAEE